MRNNNYIAVFDFETDGINTETCSPTEFACIMIDPLKLKVIDDSLFSMHVRPDGVDDKDYYEKHKDTIHFYCRNRGVNAQTILDEWKTYPDRKTVFNIFKEYIYKYNSKPGSKSMFSAPIFAGYNSYNFDGPIMNRILHEFKHVTAGGQPNLFNPRNHIDIMNLLFGWFDFNNEMPNQKFDQYREYFGMSKENAHEGYQDVKDEAAVLAAFMRFQRKIAGETNFKGILR